MNTQSATEFQKAWLAYQKQRHARPDDFKLISTGLKSLDKILGGGYELGQYVLIGGAQKSGKTTLLAEFMESAARQKKRFVWFGAEMNNLQLGTMIFSNITGIDRNKIRRIGLETYDWKGLQAAGQEIENWQGYFNYGFSKVSDITDILKAIEDQTGTNIEIVFGDYIQLMEAPTVRGGRSNEIEAISRGVKHLTLDRKHPMACVFAAQLNRESIRGKIVDANSFLGSGSLERDMDLGLIIHDIPDPNAPQRMQPNVKEIVVVGSRETGVGEPIKVLYNGSTATITDADMDEIKSADEYWT